MLDMKLLKAVMQSRAAYEKVEAHIDPGELSPQGKLWWKLVQDWYRADKNAIAVDPDILRSRGQRSLPEKHAQVLLDWFDDLPDVPSSENVVLESIAIKLHNAKLELARIASSPESTPAELSEAMAVVQTLQIATSFDVSETVLLRGNDMEDFEVLDPENKITLAPRMLNTRCKGGAVGGDHIVVFGPTEVGKSLFSINLAAHFLRCGRKVLYIGNEDRIHKIRMRIRSNLSNMTFEEMDKRREVAIQRAQQKGMTEDLLLMAHLKPGYLSEIDELADEHRPQIIVVDQFRNLGGKGDGMTQKMNDNAIGFRSLIARYDAVGVSIAQAHAGDHGKKKIWYEYDDIDSSRTGLPAQADLLVGIGADDDMLTRGTRALSLCKNKLGDDHEGIMARFDHAHSRVTA